MVAEIECSGLTKRYKDEVLTGLTFAQPRRSILGLLGRNGAGKSTALRLLLGLEEPTSGTSLLCGEDSTRLARMSFRHIGYASPDQEINGRQRVQSLLRYVSCWYPSWDDSLATKLLEDFGLQLRRRVREFSRGERAKLQLLLALAFRPRVLLLDELFSGIDPVSREEMKRSLLEVVAEAESTVLVTSHEIDDIEPLLDSALVLQRGKAAEQGTTEELSGFYRRVDARLRDISDQKAMEALSDGPDRLRVERCGRRLVVHSARWQGSSSLERLQCNPCIESVEHVRRLSLRELFHEVSRRDELPT